MNQVWFIGSVVTDVIIHIDHLPNREDDLSIQSQTMQLGGCAFNASDCFRHLQIPYHLLCPVGTGVYGDFVASQLKNLEIPILIRQNQPNGCCYCFVEKDGERTFLSHHGAEYLFTKEILSEFPIQKDDAIYISGMEIEETTGQVIIDFLRSKEPSLLLFAPGPRIGFISQEKWHAVLSLHPVLHLNENEALYISQMSAYTAAARFLHKQTCAPVIITLGHKGAYCFDGREDIFVEARQLEHIKDTIGAGDSHAGICLYGLLQKWPMEKILRHANLYAAAVVECKGGQITEERFTQLKEKEKWK